MDTPELIVAATVFNIFLTLLVAVVASRIAVDRILLAEKIKIARDKQDIAAQNELLDERMAIQLNRDNDRRIREESVNLLGHSVRQAAAVIKAERTGFDTMISQRILDDLPMPLKPDDWEATIEMPAIEGER
jgi:hypothetical protein